MRAPVNSWHRPLNWATDTVRPPLNDVLQYQTTCSCCWPERKLEMWANTQRDGRPDEHRWSPLCNAAGFGWRSLLDCRAVTLPRRETRWNLLRCPKLPDRSQPLVGRCSPYCGNIWRTYCCLTSFFPIVDTCLGCEDIARQSCAMVPRWRFSATFWFLHFHSEPHTSDLHSKFALRPHHVWKYGRHPMCMRPLRLGEEKQR